MGWRTKETWSYDGNRKAQSFEDRRGERGKKSRIKT